jgi:hypothetical protein
MEIKIKKPNDIYDLALVAIMLPLLIVGVVCFSFVVALLIALFIPIVIIMGFISLLESLWNVLKELWQ